MNVLEELPRPFFVLAPMDDVTDTVFRQVIADCARPDLFFTEFVNVDGLQSPGRPKLIHKLALTDSEKPVIAQVWGKSPENYYKTTKELKEMGFAGVDINMGCPARTVIKNGCCSALINNRGLAGEIIQAAREGAGNHFPVSVKTRVGFTTIDLSWIQDLLQYKLNMLTIHTRTVSQMSKAPAQWQLFKEINPIRTSLAPDTLLVGNGDVMSREQGQELAEEYGLDGIMIGRGVFHDPYVFAKESPWGQKTRQERIALYTKHVKLFLESYPKNVRKIHTLNKFCKIYIEGFPGAKELRERLMSCSSAPELLNQLEEAGHEVA